MKARHWLDNLLPPALIRSWATAAGFTSEWLEEPSKVQDRRQPAHEADKIPGELGTAPFDDVQ